MDMEQDTKQAARQTQKDRQVEKHTHMTQSQRNMQTVLECAEGRLCLFICLFIKLTHR